MDEIKSAIREIIKEELKSITPEKKNLPDTTEKFKEEIKSKEPKDLVGHVLKGMGVRRE